MSQHEDAARIHYRPAERRDRAALYAFLDRDVAGLDYAEVPAYFLELAFEGRESESRALIAERAGDVVGFALFGEVAGAVGTGRMHFITVSAGARLHNIGTGLCELAVADLAGRGARAVFAEVPDDPRLTSGLALLTRCGFREEARVADYCRDGVALLLLRRTIARAG